MKKGVFSMVFASALLGAASIAFAGAYGEPEQPEEIPAPPPAPVVPEPPAPRVMREFSGFLTDGETTRGLWAEIGSVYAAEYHPSHVGDAEAVNTYLHISYGQELFEVGVLAQYLYAHQDTIGEDDGFGDIRLWGKVLPIRTDMFTFGPGLIVSFPAGSDTFSTDEYGFEPFLTSSIVAGPTNIRAMVGYNVSTAPDNLADDVYDGIDANLGVLAPVGDRVVVRGEFTYFHFVESHYDNLSFFPGADIYFPVGDEMELLLRPQLGIGINQAPDWQIGLGIALNHTGI